jgi:transcriptional regulator with XRE-family HTH domain
MAKSDGSNQLVQRRRLRSELRLIRQETGETQEQVAAAMDWSLSKLIRIENGTVGISTNDLKVLLGHYGIVDNDPLEKLSALARAANERSPLRVYGTSHRLASSSSSNGLTARNLDQCNNCNDQETQWPDDTGHRRESAIPEDLPHHLHNNSMRWTIPQAIKRDAAPTSAKKLETALARISPTGKTRTHSTSSPIALGHGSTGSCLLRFSQQVSSWSPSDTSQSLV